MDVVDVVVTLVIVGLPVDGLYWSEKSCSEVVSTSRVEVESP